jgi:hypothetical protein
MVKLFTIVKDEVDIVKDWLIYHGSMFGWNNIYVIDNYSTDGTYEVIQEFKDLINIYREHDYKKKGEYMTNLINKHSNGNDTLAFPIDIDEFIVYYDKNSDLKSISIDKGLITNYINNLPPCRVYKANYLYPILTKPEGFSRVTVNTSYSNYCDMGCLAKSFVNTKYFKGSIDHGNHLSCNDYHLTNIALVHYHSRNIEQIKKKSLNNIIGLGYDPNSLKDLIHRNPSCMGSHHINTQIQIQEGNFKLGYIENPDPSDTISIDPLRNRIIGGYF